MEKLGIGEKAPHFEAKDQNGQLVNLKNYLGKKVVLYFYPKDDTPGCTAQACNLRDNYEALLEGGLAVICVSPDAELAHQKFAKKYDLPFPLLPDPEKNIIQAYGVWGKKNMYGKIYEGVLRTTYLIDEKGIIEHVFSKVETANHTAQILKALKK